MLFVANNARRDEMKKIPLILLFALFSMPVLAQSAAQQVVPGYLGSNGCKGGGSAPCYRQDAVPIYSSAAEASHVLKASPGTLFGLSVTSSAAGYVLVYNSKTVPADGAVTPIACYYLSSGPGSLGVVATPFPISMSTGISVAFSSTGCFTQTSSATAFFSAQIM
jgi:hypothetical protein